jgi:outer membrane biogenesis lipoprotein LolB
MDNADQGRPPLIKKIETGAFMALAAILVSAGCRAPRANIAPIPAVLNEIEGYASLRVTMSGESARSKFSFVLEPSRRAKVDIQDWLGRTAAEIHIDAGEAYFVLRSKKVYWKALPDEIIEKFLGSRLSLQEMTSLLCGRWKGERMGDRQTLSEWIFNEDDEGRKASGRKGDFEFKVREFFPGSPVPRRLDFQSVDGRGSITVLVMAFNKPVADRLFTKDFLKDFSPKIWEDIEKILKYEN